MDPSIPLKLLLAAVLGGIIGIEREIRDKPAGLRTNILICVGSTLFMSISTKVAALLGHGQMTNMHRIKGPSEDPHAHCIILHRSAGRLGGAIDAFLTKQGSGPYFNGASYALVDAAYAPFLQRYDFLDRIKPLGQIEKYPRLAAWRSALMERRSTHSFPPAEFESMYRANVKRRNKWLSQFIAAPQVAAA